MLEARTAPGNQQRTAARRGRREARGEWDVIWCSHREDSSQWGNKERGGNGTNEKSDECKAGGARNKERKAH